jgi:hypothetical protein
LRRRGGQFAVGAIWKLHDGDRLTITNYTEPHTPSFAAGRIASMLRRRLSPRRLR